MVIADCLCDGTFGSSLVLYSRDGSRPFHLHSILNPVDPDYVWYSRLSE